MFKLSNIEIAADRPRIERAKALYEIQKWKARSPYKFFVPNYPQFQGIKAIGSLVPEKRIFVMTSGNGVGKTTMVILFLQNIIRDNANIFRNIRDPETGKNISGFFDFPLYRNWPADWPKKIWFVSTQDGIKNTWEEFEFWIPEREYEPIKGGKNFYSQVEFKATDWSLFFKTTNQDPDKFESANVGIIVFDEPPPEVLFTAAFSRLRTGGIIVIAATPLFGSSWMQDLLERNHRANRYVWHQRVSVHENNQETCGYWNLGIWGKQPKGRLTTADIKFMVSGWDDEEREAREHGKFQHLTGLIYKSYKHEPDEESGLCHYVNVVNPIDPRLYVYQFVVDPHDRRPAFALWIRIDQYGRRRVIREWPGQEDTLYGGRMFHKIKTADPHTVEDFVSDWIRIEKSMGIPEERVQSIMDPNFGQKPERVTGKTVAETYSETYKKFGMNRGFITNVIDDLNVGHKKVRSFLKPTDAGDLYLQIDRSCVSLNWAMRNYKYIEWQGKTADRRDLSEVVSEKGKDPCDCLRYALITPIKWRPPEYTPAETQGDYGYHEQVSGTNEPDRPKGAAGV